MSDREIIAARFVWDNVAYEELRRKTAVVEAAVIECGSDGRVVVKDRIGAQRGSPPPGEPGSALRALAAMVNRGTTSMLADVADRDGHVVKIELGRLGGEVRAWARDDVEAEVGSWPGPLRLDETDRHVAGM